MTPIEQRWAVAIDEWLVSLGAAGQPRTTLRTRRQHVTQLALHGGLPDPWAVTTEDLLRWMDSNTWALETRHGHRTSLRGFYAWAKRRGHVDRDPALELPRVRRTPPSARPVPERVFLAALSDADDRTALMLRLAGEHGLRRAEIAQVHSGDVFDDLLGYSLTVHGKGGKPRVVPLADDVALVILAAEGWAFPGRVDGHLSPWWVGKLVGRALASGYTTHKLRHRFASSAYAVDHDLFTVQALLGHASAETTRRYVQLPDDAKRRLVAAVATPAARPRRRLAVAL